MKEVLIYLMKLENEKYYLTYTTNEDSRLGFERHTSEINNVEWTKINKPLLIIEEFKGSMELLRKISSDYIVRYGVNNIRGTFINEYGIKKSSTKKKKKLKSCLDLDISKLDDQLDIRVLKMDSTSTKKFIVVKSIDSQSFYSKLANGLLPTGIVDVPISIQGTSAVASDLLIKITSKYGDGSVSLWTA